MTIDLSVVGGLVVAAIALLTFWMALGSRITKAEILADAASKAAAQAQKDVKEANEKLAIMGAAHSLYREQVAREYIHKEVMREVEDRLTAAIDRLGERLDRVLERSDQRNEQRHANHASK